MRPTEPVKGVEGPVDSTTEPADGATASGGGSEEPAESLTGSTGNLAAEPHPAPAVPSSTGDALDPGVQPGSKAAGE